MPVWVLRLLWQEETHPGEVSSLEPKAIVLLLTTTNSMKSCAPDRPQQMAHSMPDWHLDAPPQLHFFHVHVHNV